MDRTLVEKLENRARTLLPAETAMMAECWADSGDRMCAAVLKHIQRCGMFDEPLCDQPYRLIPFDDRVLLRCQGCDKMNALPKIRGVGYGETEDEAHRNALYALTLPIPSDEREYGRGSIRAVEESCIYNRVAYAQL